MSAQGRALDEDEVERLTRIGVERDALTYDDSQPDEEELAMLADIDAGRDLNGAARSGKKKRPPRWTAAAQRARALAAAPLPARLPLAGMPTLVRCTRGGLPVGARVTITGAPGASKTTLVLQWAHEWAEFGARVVVLCADQDPDYSLSRLAERLEIARDDIEGIAGDDARRNAWTDLARELDHLPNLLFLDGGEDGFSIESAADVLDVMPGDGPRVLIVDSVQEATCSVMAGLAAQGQLSRVPKREQIDASGRACRRIARRGILVILVSEMSRGGYGGSDDKRRTSPLASSKESGSIEYRADLLMVLRRQKGDPDMVDVAVPKSRLGEELDLCLRISRGRASLMEVDKPNGRQGTPETSQASIRAEVDRDAAELAKLLAAHPDGLGTRDLRAELRASGLKWGPERLDAARAALQRGCNGVRIVNRSPNNRSRRWALEHLPKAES